jgi:hypothetical protein
MTPGHPSQAEGRLRYSSASVSSPASTSATDTKSSEPDNYSGFFRLACGALRLRAPRSSLRSRV